MFQAPNGLNDVDPKTSNGQQQEIYDVPPSSLQGGKAAAVRNHVTGSSRPEEVVYDVPPTQNEVTYDSPRCHQTLPARASNARTTEQTEYQVPSTLRNVPRKVLDNNRPWSLSENVPGSIEGTSSAIKSRNGNIHRSEADDATRPASARAFGTVSENAQGNVSDCGVGHVSNNTHAANIRGNLEENVPQNVLGNVRVCVEDEDDSSSEKSHGGGVMRCLSPNTVGKERQGCGSGPLLYDSISPINQSHPESLQVFHAQQNRLHPSFQPTNRQQSWNQTWNKHGSSMTLPRHIGDARSEDARLSRLGGHRNEARKSAETCAVLRIPELRKGGEYDRDSVLDEYSVPRSYGTLSPTRPHSASNLNSHTPRLDYDAVFVSPKTVETYRRSPIDPGTLDGPRRARIESDNSEFQLSFVDTGIYVDCPQDPDSVSDLMDSLDRTVRSQVAKVRELCLGFDSTSTCRRREEDVSQMKLCCVSLRTALKEVADLGTSVLANAMQLTNRDLSENILQQLEMLRTMSQDLGSTVDLVISCTSQGGAPTGRTDRGSLRDALNSLMTLTHDIVSSLATMNELVGKNSALVFPQPKSLPPAPIPLAICGSGGQEFRAASPLTPLSQETLQRFRATSPLVMSMSPVPVVGFTREFGSGSPIPPTMVQIPGSGSIIRELQTPSPINPSSHPPPVSVAMRDIRSVSPLPPSSPAVSEAPRAFSLASPNSTWLEPKPHIRNRPLPPLPFGQATSSLETSELAELNAEDNDYAAIVTEAELELRRNVCALVGRLADRSGVNAAGKAKVTGEVNEVELLRPEADSATGRNLGGLSPQFKERLDALRPKTEQTMRITTCARSRDASPSSSNPTAIQGFFSEFLVGIDREIVHFYADEVRGHYAAVDSATRDFLFAVSEGKVTGNELTNLSRTVVLAAHKLVYASDAITKKLMGDEELRRQVGVIASDLCLRLRETVAASKAAAAADSAAATDVGLGCNQREQMLNCMREVKYLSLQLRDVIFAHLLEKIY